MHYFVFTAPFCRPSQALTKNLKELVDESDITIYDLTTPEGNQNGIEHNVVGTPMTIISSTSNIKDGAHLVIGYRNKEQLELLLKESKI